MWAFKSCNKLKKITILDNVETMEGYNSSNSDLVFQNHDDELTIYCYENSMAAKYAIKYNIKYVYLTRPSTDDPGQDNSNNKPADNNKPTDSNKKDDTTATGKLPQTGVSFGLAFIIVILLGGSIFAYAKYKNLRGI